MANAAYVTVDIDLAAAVADAVVPIGKVGNAQVAFCGILDSPAGADVSLRFGNGGEDVPITDRWSGLAFNPPHDGGVYYVVGTVAVGTVKLFFGFAQPC